MEIKLTAGSYGNCGRRALGAGLLVLAAWGVPATALKAEVPSRVIARDADRYTQKHVLSWYEMKRQNIVLQQRDFSCGAAALATVIRYYWGDAATEDLFLRDLARMLTPEEMAERVENGLSLTDLRRLAVRQGYQAALGKLSFAELTKSKVPLVVGIITNDYDHFVVYRGWDGEWVYLADPTRGNIRIPTWEFVQQWQENAVLVVAKPGAKPRDFSPLSVTAAEVHVGDMNWQVIRTLPERAGF